MIHILNYIKKNKVLWPVILLGFIAHMAMIFPSGTEFCYQNKCGLYFFGVHGTDSIWHLALSAVSFHSWPFIMPIFSGATLGGYNYLMDLVIFLISKFGIPVIFIYFKLLPIIWFALFTFSLIKFGRLIHDSKAFVAILLFLSYFCGSLAYIYSFWHHGTLWGSSGLVALQSLHSLANMQYAFSLIIVLEVFVIIKRNVLGVKETRLLALLIFIAMGLKFYGGVVSLFLAGMFILTKLLPLNKHFLRTFIFGISILLSALLSLFLFYNPFGSASTGAIFSFDPLATVHPTLESPELFHLPDLVNARYTLNGHIGPRLIYIESLTLLIYIIMNFGIRILGILDVFAKSITGKVAKWESLAILTIVLTILLNILFVQKGEWWNTVQFLYYGIFISTLLTSQFIYSLLKKRHTIITVLALSIILVSLPIDIDLIMQFTSPKSMSYIPKQEQEALTFLKKQPKGVVFQPLYDSQLMHKFNYPYPMFANYDNAYVAAFSEKQVFYSTEVQLRLVGVDYKNRLSQLKNLDCNILKQVDYLYIVKDNTEDFFNKCINGNKSFKKIYANDSVWIYTKNKG